jgi:hypothetical protein
MENTNNLKEINNQNQGNDIEEEKEIINDEEKEKNVTEEDKKMVLKSIGRDIREFLNR